MQHRDKIEGSISAKVEVNEGMFKVIDILEGDAADYFLLQAKNDSMKAKTMLKKFQMEGNEPVVVFVLMHTESDLKFREFDRLNAPGDYKDMHHNSTYAKIATYGPVSCGTVVKAVKNEKGYLTVVAKA